MEIRIFILLLAGFGLSGCVPSNMHVTYGLNPRYVDDDVRFRTTYYFRTFDYCWDADVKLVPLATQGAQTIDYRKIIPQTDTLYRYRMTGMASAAFSRIRFESGTLRKEQIDPFGAQVTYSRSANGFYIRSAGDVKSDAEAAKIREAQLARIKAIKEEFKDAPAEQRAVIDKLIESATQTYLAGSVLSDSDRTALQAAIDTLRSELTEAKATLKAAIDAAKPAADQTQAVASLQTRVAALEAAKAGGTGNELGPCGIGDKVRKGFQIMGPEGIRTFDQEERLLMAMTSSAEPLIGTLQEYSGRILNSKSDMSAQLVALAEENARAERARRGVSDARLAKTGGSILLAEAAKSFGAAGDTK